MPKEQMSKTSPRTSAPKETGFDKTFTFRLRRHSSGNFSGLWELSRLDERGEIETMVSDADGLSFCLENLQGLLEDEGF